MVFFSCYVVYVWLDVLVLELVLGVLVGDVV